MNRVIRMGRRLVILVWYRMLCGLFSLLPVRKNKVAFSNFSGKRYGDSPKYISEALHEAHPEIRIVWQRERRMSFEFPAYVKVVRFPSVRWMYEMMTAGVWVDSHLKPFYLSKRRNQFFLNTWHGGLGFKRIQMDRAGSGMDIEKRRAVRTAKMVDVFLSNSDWITEIYRTAFKYEGKVAATGFPKNDLFFKDNRRIRNSIRERYHLSDQFVILYAPTFREHPVETSFSLDPARVVEAARRTVAKGREPIMLVRWHPMMLDYAGGPVMASEHVINVTDYPDAQELLLACDCVISDYSSIVFDAMLLRMPVFLFTPDYEQYRKEQGFYLEREAYPFSYGDDTEAVCRSMEAFDPEEYLKKVEAFSARMGLCENGSATEQACGIIMEHIGG